MTIRDGFIIPNASTYSPDYQTSQPDQGDFLLLGNGRFGVVTGCAVSVDGYSASVGSGPNILVIDGDVFSITSSSTVSFSGPGVASRFDLVVFDKNDGLKVVPGTPAANPVFPDITSTMVVLAALYVPVDGGSASVRLIDKRVFLQTSVVSTDGPLAQPVIKRLNSSGDSTKFEVNSSGKILWNSGGTYVEPVSAGDTDGYLKVYPGIQATNVVAINSLTVGGNPVVTTDQIHWGSSFPSLPAPSTGDIHIDTSTGSVYVRRVDEWNLVDTNVPIGTVIMSFAPPSAMPGWLLLDGSLILQGDAGGLWDMFSSWRVSASQIRLPDMRGRFPIGTPTGVSAGQTSGVVYDNAGGVSVLLTEGNLPSHSHRPLVAGTPNLTGGGGGHTPTFSWGEASGAHGHTTELGGSHDHAVVDSEHRHGWDGDYGIVASANGADTCLDIVFNDASHSHTTKPVAFTGPSPSGVTVAPSSTHAHSIGNGGSHTHTVTVNAVSDHTHPIPAHNSVGYDLPFVVQPPAISINFYIKT